MDSLKIQKYYLAQSNTMFALNLPYGENLEKNMHSVNI